MFRRSLFLCVFMLLAVRMASSEEVLEVILPVAPAFDLEHLAPPGAADTAIQTAHSVPARYADMVYSIAAKYGVSWQLVASVMKHESNFRPRATSNRGARGLMQLTPRTASRYKVTANELYDPYKNIEAGVQHLRMLIDRYAGNLELAVAAYNTGEFAVDRHRGIPPFRTTRIFVKKVLSQYLAWL